MRKWTMFSAAVFVPLVVLALLYAPLAAQAKTTAQDDKTSKNAVVSVGTKKHRDASASARKGAEAKHAPSKHASAEHASAKHGPVLAQDAPAGKKAKHQRSAPSLAAKERAACLPVSFTGEFQIDTKASLLMDMKSGRVLYAQDADTPIPPASLTKVLTLYLLNEYLQAGKLKADETIPVTTEASHQGGSTMRLRTGEQVPVEELIKGIAIASANDGCMAVAQYLGKGDPAPFIAAMNQKAKELGMSNSLFLNPNGLPAEGQVTTARDMALLAKQYLERFPEVLAIHSTTEFTHNNRVRHNSNSLLGKVEGVDGLKTGFVCASGFNIVVTAKRGDTRLVAVVLGAKNRRVREREATRLVEEGFRIVAAELRQDDKQVALSASAGKAATTRFH